MFRPSRGHLQDDFLNIPGRLDDWLTVLRSITLIDFQLDAQNSYLFIYNAFIKILYMFRALPCSSSGGLCFLTGAQDSHLQRVTIPEAAYIQLDLLKMSRAMLETCRGF
jgi:hypothetical protein